MKQSAQVMPEIDTEMSIQSGSDLGRVLSFKWHPNVAVSLCAFLGTLVPAAYGLTNRIPEPVVHDEFSYLLAADTFAHGRLTNPTPDLPEFFEAEHVLLVPTYMSKYPFGQGVALAAGQVIFGHPIWGVWLSFGCFAASLCWMLQAWTSKSWAFAVAVLVIFSLGVDTYWTQSYWGGNVAACGGALLFGGMRRTIRHARFGSSLLMAMGVVLLATTRPLEGALVCLPVAAVMSWWLIAGRPERWSEKIKLWVMPFVMILLAGGCALANYNRAVTGQWMRFPYTLHQQQYFHQGVFIFSTIRPPERQPNARIAGFYEISESATPVRGLRLVRKVLVNFYRRLPDAFLSALGELDGRGRRMGGLLWVGAVLVVTLRSRWVWLCLLTIAFVVLGGSFVPWWIPHYTAPIQPLAMAVFADALRRIGLAFRANRRLGVLTPLIVVSLASFYGIAVLGASALPGIHRAPTGHNSEVEEVPSKTSLITSRGDLIRRLNQQDGSHLVFVRYAENYPFADEWVYNAADIESAKVVFAHDLGDRKNGELIARHLDRSVWLVTVSAKKKQLEPYRPADVAGPGTAVPHTQGRMEYGKPSSRLNNADGGFG